MTITVRYGAPAQLVAGDSLEFLQQVPADLAGWTGSARLTGPTPMDATTIATEGTDYHITFAGQQAGGTRDLLPGQYTLTIWATNGTNRYTVAQYRLSVTPDLSTGEPALEHAIKMLGLIESAIEARIAGTPDGGIEGYEINGRKISKLSLPQLTGLRNRYAAEVRTLQNPGAPIARIKAVFTAAGFEPVQTRRYDTQGVPVGRRLI